jgi:hypothetical protein
VFALARSYGTSAASVQLAIGFKVVKLVEQKMALARIAIRTRH